MLEAQCFFLFLRRQKLLKLREQWKIKFLCGLSKKKNVLFLSPTSFRNTSRLYGKVPCFFKLLIAQIWKNKDNGLKEWWLNYVWKFLFIFLSISLLIKSVSEKILHLTQGWVSTRAMGHTFASLWTRDEK